MPSLRIKRSSNTSNMLINNILERSDTGLSLTRKQSFSPGGSCSEDSGVCHEFEYMIPHLNERKQKIKLRQLVKASEALTFEITTLAASKEIWLKQFQQFEVSAYSSLKNVEKWSQENENRLRINDEFASNWRTEDTKLNIDKCATTVDTLSNTFASNIQGEMTCVPVRESVWHLSVSDLISVFGRTKLDEQGESHFEEAVSPSHMDGSSYEGSIFITSESNMVKDTFISIDCNTSEGSSNYFSLEHEIPSDDQEICRLFMLEENDFFQNEHEETIQQPSNLEELINDISTVGTGVERYVNALESHESSVEGSKIDVLGSRDHNLEGKNVLGMGQRALMEDEILENKLIDGIRNLEEVIINNLETNNCVDVHENDALNLRKEKDALEFEYNMSKIKLEEARKNVDLLEIERQNLIMQVREDQKPRHSTHPNHILHEREKHKLQSNSDEFRNKVDTILQRTGSNENEKHCIEEELESLILDFKKIEQELSMLETQNDILFNLLGQFRQKLEETQHRMKMLEREREALECEVNEYKLALGEAWQHATGCEGILENINSCNSKQEKTELYDLTGMQNAFEERSDGTKHQLQFISEIKQNNVATEGSAPQSSVQNKDLESQVDKVHSDADATESHIVSIEEDFSSMNVLNESSATEQTKRMKMDMEPFEYQVSVLINENENRKSSFEACTQSHTELESGRKEIQFELQNTESHLQKTIGEFDLMKSKHGTDLTLGSDSQMQIRSEENAKDLELDREIEIEEQNFLRPKKLETQSDYIEKDFLSVKLQKRVKTLEAEKKRTERALQKERAAKESLTKELYECQAQYKTLKDALLCMTPREQSSMQVFLGEVEEACQEAIMLELEEQENNFKLMEMRKALNIEEQDNEDVERTNGDMIDVLDNETQLPNHVSGKQVRIITNTGCLGEGKDKYPLTSFEEAPTIVSRMSCRPQGFALNVTSTIDAHLTTVSEMACLLGKLKALRDAVHEKAVVAIDAKEKKAHVPVPVAVAYTGALAAFGFLTFKKFKQHGLI